MAGLYFVFLVFPFVHFFFFFKPVDEWYSIDEHDCQRVNAIDFRVERPLDG